MDTEWLLHFPKDFPNNWVADLEGIFFINPSTNRIDCGPENAALPRELVLGKIVRYYDRNNPDCFAVAHHRFGEEEPFLLKWARKGQAHIFGAAILDKQGHWQVKRLNQVIRWYFPDHPAPSPFYVAIVDEPLSQGGPHLPSYN